MTTDADLQHAIRDLLRRELQAEARDFQQLKGGRNSRVFRVECDAGRAFAVKAYFQSESDRRDRLGCEFRALQLLKGKGLSQVATPLTSEAGQRIAIFEFVEGEPLPAATVSESEIDQAVAFLRSLKDIADGRDAAHFPAASEACFSIAAILQNLDARFRRLHEVSVHEPALADFLHHELAPIRTLAEEKCRESCRGHDIAIESEIATSERTLSPSDFGFHNALRRADGRLVFLDFEYFGWDDPAKTVSDFLLHPAMDVPPALRQRFFAGIIAGFASVPNLQQRVRAVYPLFGLKWCAILLNEFTFEHLARRRFADGAPDASNQDSQLDKARRMLAKVTNDLRDFPYHA